MSSVGDEHTAAGAAHAGAPVDTSPLADIDAPQASRPSLAIEPASVVWITGAVLVVLAVVAVFRSAPDEITKIAIGIILALALDPLVVKVAGRLDCRRSVAVAAVVAGGLVAMGALVVFVGPAAARQGAAFGKELPQTLSDIESLPLVGGSLRRIDFAASAQSWIDGLPSRFDAATVENLAGRLLRDVLGLVTVAAVMVGALLDGPKIVALLRSPLRRNPRRLAQADRVGQVLSVTLGQYFGGSLTVAALMGTFVLVVGLVLHIPLAPLAALWALFTDLIPQVGGFLGGAFLTVLALTKSPTTALIALALFLVYMNLENHLIAPAIVGQSVDLSAPTTMIAALVGGAVAGLPGTLVATPLAGAAKRLWIEARTGKLTPVNTHPGIVERLRGLLARVRPHREP